MTRKLAYVVIGAVGVFGAVMLLGDVSAVALMVALPLLAVAAGVIALALRALRRSGSREERFRRGLLAELGMDRPVGPYRRGRRPPPPSVSADELVDELLGQAEQMLEASPRSARLRSSVALLLRRAGRHDEARAQATRAIEALVLSGDDETAARLLTAFEEEREALELPPEVHAVLVAPLRALGEIEIADWCEERSVLDELAPEPAPAG